MRIGGIKPFKVDVRFIATANRGPVETAREEPFRRDLFFPVERGLPPSSPLAERRDDIPLLSYFFLQKHAAGTNRAVSELSTDTLSLLMNYNFPGNVRELENIIERASPLPMTEPSNRPTCRQSAGAGHQDVQKERRKDPFARRAGNSLYQVGLKRGRGQQDSCRPGPGYRPRIPLEEAEEIRARRIARGSSHRGWRNRYSFVRAGYSRELKKILVR